MIERIVANGHGALSPKYLAVHSTANPGATAANHVSYWSREPKYAVHAVSDWNEAYHTVPWDRLCYQVGKGNSTCIGIEICEATNYDDFMRGMEIARNAIWDMLIMKGWNVDDHVRSHLWFTENYGGSDHTDPIPYLKRWGKDWNWFINFLKEDYDMQLTDIVNRPDGVETNVGNVLGFSDKRLEKIDNELLRTDDPTGRGKDGVGLYDRVLWMAAKQEQIMTELDETKTEISDIKKLIEDIKQTITD